MGFKKAFSRVGRAFKKTGIIIGHTTLDFVKSDLAREIAIAAFTAGGIPKVAQALRLIDTAVEGGAAWEVLKGELLARAVKNPEEADLLLSIIRDYEVKLRALEEKN